MVKNNNMLIYTKNLFPKILWDILFIDVIGLCATTDSFSFYLANLSFQLVLVLICCWRY